MEYGAFQQEADHYNNKGYDLSFHGLLSFAVFVLGIQHLLLCRSDDQDFLKLAEIYGRRDIAGAGKVVGIYFHLADIADKQALKESVADMGGNYLLPYFTLLSLFGSFSKRILPSAISFKSPLTTQVSDVDRIMALILLASSMVERTRA